MKEFRLCLLYIEHWLRTSYICCLWSNAELDDVYASLPLPEESGWAVSNGEYTIDSVGRQNKDGRHRSSNQSNVAWV
jgi:hypothetical protein